MVNSENLSKLRKAFVEAVMDEVNKDMNLDLNLADSSEENAAAPAEDLTPVIEDNANVEAAEPAENANLEAAPAEAL